MWHSVTMGKHRIYQYIKGFSFWVAPQLHFRQKLKAGKQYPCRHEDQFGLKIGMAAGFPP
jgi:hypothetical protein